MDATGLLTGLAPQISLDMFDDSTGTEDAPVEIIKQTIYNTEKSRALMPFGIFFAPVLQLLDTHTWVAGGSVVRWLEKAEENEADFDLFTTYPEQLKKRLEGLDGYIPIKTTFLSWTFLYTPTQQRVQVIRRSYQDIEAVLRSFDFLARMAGIDASWIVHYSDKTLADIDNKRIRHHKGDNSLKASSLYGIVKYANRGYKIDHGESRKFLLGWGVTPESEEY